MIRTCKKDFRDHFSPDFNTEISKRFCGSLSESGLQY